MTIGSTYNVCVCMVIASHSRVPVHVIIWIIRVRLLNLLLVVSLTGKINISLSPFAPEDLASRDRFDRLVPRHPPHSPHPGSIWCLPAGFISLSAATSIYLYRQPPSGQSRVYQTCPAIIAYRRRSLPRVRRHRPSSAQGSPSNQWVLPLQVSLWTI